MKEEWTNKNFSNVNYSITATLLLRRYEYLPVRIEKFTGGTITLQK